MSINLVKAQLKEGYLPRADTGHKNVFLGEARVKNDNNQCALMAVNCQPIDISFYVNPRELVSYYDEPQAFDPETVSELEVPIPSADERKRE